MTKSPIKIRKLLYLFLICLVTLWSAPALAAPGRAAGIDPTSTTAPPELEAEPEPDQPRIEVDWYGYLKLDAAWDDSLVDAGNFARWVAPPSLVEEHSHFNMTARQSRIGVDIDHQPETGPPIRAKIEIDFYGGGAENKNRPQLRHAYFDLLWPQRGWTLRAGQTSDVISPLAPTTVNYTVAWWAGNIGYRRPMARLTKTSVSNAGAETQLTLALSRTIGDDFGSSEPGDSGVDSGVPTLQASATRSWSLRGDRTATVGVSGHYGRERVEETLGQPVPEFDSWSANVHLRLPIGARSSLEAEAWTGANLDDYFGGVGQGIDLERENEVEATGGWMSLKSRLRSDLLGSIGLGLDDPDDASLGAGGRIRNQAAWANLLWDVGGAIRFGAEVSWWETRYAPPETGDSLRLQLALIYNFAG